MIIAADVTWQERCSKFRCLVVHDRGEPSSTQFCNRSLPLGLVVDTVQGSLQRGLWPLSGAFQKSVIVVYFGSVSLSDCQEIEEGIQPGNVYTLCFWSASRFLDLMGATCLHVRMQFSFRYTFEMLSCR